MSVCVPATFLGRLEVSRLTGRWGRSGWVGVLPRPRLPSSHRAGEWGALGRLRAPPQAPAAFNDPSPPARACGTVAPPQWKRPHRLSPSLGRVPSCACPQNRGQSLIPLPSFLNCGRRLIGDQMARRNSGMAASQTRTSDFPVPHVTDPPPSPKGKGHSEPNAKPAFYKQTRGQTAAVKL